MNNLYKSTILAYNKDMFARLVAENTFKLMAELAVNNPVDMMLIQFKEANTEAVSRFIESFRRTDSQYVFEGNFYYREELEEKIKPYCKEMCISLAPKGPQKPGKHIDADEEYGYLTVATLNPMTARSYVEVR